jgi:phosphoglycolate phosphatase
MEALIFDFDGTLAELNLDFAALRDEVLAEAQAWGGAPPWPRGHLLEQVQALAGPLGRPFALRALELIQQRELAAAERGRLLPHTGELLARARRRGLAIAVVSRNCGPAIRRVFPQVESATDAFLPREAVARPKPHPDHLRAACRALGVAPASAAMVGDHPTDMQAARAAGCRAVGVTTGRTPAGELAAAGAHAVLAHAGLVLEED